MLNILAHLLRISPLVLITLGSGVPLHAQSPEVREVLGLLSAKWDLDQRPAGFPAFLELRQEDNKFPAYWAGRYAGEKPLILKPGYDILDGSVSLQSEGSFVVNFTHTAPRPGLEEQIPGGVWMHGAADRRLRVHFTRFDEWRYPATGEAADSRRIEAAAVFHATLLVDDFEVPLEGESLFHFDESTGAFTMIAKTVFEGSAAGLEKNQAGPIELTLYLRSAAPRPMAIAEPDLSLDGPDDFDFPGF